MAVSRLDENGDWVFGKNLAGYIRNSEEIQQNIVTRIKSFANDWFLDTDAEIDWFTILGNRGNEQTIIREVERVTLETDGVKTIEKLQVSSDPSTRQATILLCYTDIFSNSSSIEETIL